MMTDYKPPIGKGIPLNYTPIRLPAIYQPLVDRFFRAVAPARPVRAVGMVEIASPLTHADMTTGAASKVILETVGMVQAKGERGA